MAISKNIRVTPVKTIRSFCLTCKQNVPEAIEKCNKPNCQLYIFRMGHNPNRAGIGGRKRKLVKRTVTENVVTEQHR